MNQKSIFALFALVIGISNAVAGSGALKGVVPILELKKRSTPIDKYRGKISGKVAEAAPPAAGVWLEAPHLTAPKNPPSAALPQHHYQFTKSMIVVPVGTELAFPNKDTDYHNIYSLSRAKRFDLGRYKRNQTPAPTVLFDKAGFIQLRCEIHDHMKADVLVVDTPYFTLTDSKGRFSLKNIPAGKYVLHARVDRKHHWQLPVEVISGDTVTIQLPRK